MFVTPTLMTITKGLMPVINTDDESIVLIPRSYDGLNSLSKLEGTDTLTISGEQYKEVAKALGLQKSFKGAAQTYFAQQCKAVEIAANTRISEEGWAAVFEAYAEEGYTIPKMLKLIPKIVPKYNEISTKKILEVVRFKPTGLTEEQQVGAGIAVIACDDNTIYERHYMVNNEVMILYTHVLPNVPMKFNKHG